MRNASSGRRLVLEPREIHNRLLTSYIALFIVGSHVGISACPCSLSISPLLDCKLREGMAEFVSPGTQRNPSSDRLSLNIC